MRIVAACLRSSLVSPRGQANALTHPAISCSGEAPRGWLERVAFALALCAIGGASQAMQDGRAAQGPSRFTDFFTESQSAACGVAPASPIEWKECVNASCPMIVEDQERRSRYRDLPGACEVSLRRAVEARDCEQLVRPGERLESCEEASSRTLSSPHGTSFCKVEYRGLISKLAEGACRAEICGRLPSPFFRCRSLEHGVDAARVRSAIRTSGPAETRGLALLAQAIGRSETVIGIGHLKLMNRYLSAPDANTLVLAERFRALVHACGSSISNSLLEAAADTQARDWSPPERCLLFENRQDG
jgi:hypothetical protein